MHVTRLYGAQYPRDSDAPDVEMLMSIPAWVIPMIATAMMSGGAVMQNRAQQKASNKQFELQRARQKQKSEAEMRSNLMRIDAMERQRGFDTQRQSEFAKAIQEAYGPGREERRGERVGELNASQAAALKGQVKGGRLYAGAKSGTKGRVSGKVAKGRKKGIKANKATHKRRGGLRSTIGSFKQQGEDDAKISVALNQAMMMNSQRARSAAELDEMRAKIEGQVGPEDLTILNPNSLTGDLLSAGGAGLFSYAPYAPTGGPIATTAQAGGAGPASRGAGRNWLQGQKYPPG